MYSVSKYAGFEKATLILRRREQRTQKPDGGTRCQRKQFAT